MSTWSSLAQSLAGHRFRRAGRDRDPASSRSASRRARPAIQDLESRRLLAAAIYNPTNGTLVVNVSEVPNQRVAVGQVGGLVAINGNTGGIVSTLTGRPLPSVSASRVTYIDVQGTPYRDIIDLSGVQGRAFSALSKTLLSTDLHGRGGNDQITGSDFSDRIFGDAGDDVLSGRGGNDAIYGGADRNTLDGGDGDDNLYGDPLASNDYDGGTGYDIVNKYDKRRDRRIVNVEEKHAN